jgi:signal transduction histidine kinase
MTRFGADPEGEGIAAPSDRDDEIGIAERELATLQHQLRGQLQSKARLAALGLAVSKINHDLRNLLASAQLLSERLEDSTDPMVKRVAPKLLSTIERAVDYCRSVLAYGRAQEKPPERMQVLVEDVVDDAEEAVTLGRPGRIAWISAIERGLTVDADPDQLFRVLMNLTGNAVQALESKGDLDPARDQIRISGRREGSLVIIEVSDTGPGLSEKAREHLFEAFHGSTRPGGTGLGLVISHEIIRAHGGEIRLVEGTLGATFRIAIPDRPLDLAAHARERKRART